ncbi:hypothetical protein [Ralstonia mannitolilytica]|uniref:Uncharacterized protein n=1 Tax=Ralstonia mannitolilytica TaxID=105219 RepID=A0AAD2AUD0_9RALS|nr:hypothetical protein [Ralstonia mannitolilytica]ATG21582.1 hypothetical protein CO705_16660 [Ralstonia pickettii]MBY4716520.1 hypothetical protein [Ralstonia mannitolilytica]CAJ0689625.1 hypothetical protein R77591_03448 [Ralstonia mannitolilytica]CAJ0704582.1 hypothetical protein LMG18102_04256 [Ralstonia mannitolilytica]CAJ0718614.1 hypothetical protein LMG8323_03976 [Ralstonia mannitolilytica]
MSAIKRGTAGWTSRLGWERHAADWQVIPTRRRLFQTRLPATRIPTILLWLAAVSIALGVGRIVLNRWW